MISMKRLPDIQSTFRQTAKRFGVPCVAVMLLLTAGGCAKPHKVIWPAEYPPLTVERLETTETAVFLLDDHNEVVRDDRCIPYMIGKRTVPIKTNGAWTKSSYTVFYKEPVPTDKPMEAKVIPTLVNKENEREYISKIYTRWVNRNTGKITKFDKALKKAKIAKLKLAALTGLSIKMGYTIIETDKNYLKKNEKDCSAYGTVIIEASNIENKTKPLPPQTQLKALTIQ